MSVAARNEEILDDCNFLWIKIALFHRRGTSYPLPHIVALIVLAECVSRSSQYTEVQISIMLLIAHDSAIISMGVTRAKILHRRI